MNREIPKSLLLLTRLFPVRVWSQISQVSGLAPVYESLPSHSGLMTQPDSSVGNADVRFGSCPFCKGIIRLVMILGDRLELGVLLRAFHTLMSELPVQPGEYALRYSPLRGEETEA